MCDCQSQQRAHPEVKGSLLVYILVPVRLTSLLPDVGSDIKSILDCTSVVNEDP